MRLQDLAEMDVKFLVQEVRHGLRILLCLLYAGVLTRFTVVLAFCQALGRTPRTAASNDDIAGARVLW